MKMNYAVSVLLCVFLSVPVTAHASNAKTAKGAIASEKQRLISSNEPEDKEIGYCDACHDFCDSADGEGNYVYDGKKFKKFEGCFAACIKANHGNRSDCN